MKLHKILRDIRGSAAVEFALAIPVLATLMIAVLQFGILMHTSGSIRHAAGEGLRFAKINPAATDAQIISRTREAMAGIDQSGITALNFQRGTTNGAQFGRLTITYNAQPIVPFIPAQAVVLSETKQVYLQN